MRTYATRDAYTAFVGLTCSLGDEAELRSVFATPEDELRYIYWASWEGESYTDAAARLRHEFHQLRALPEHARGALVDAVRDISLRNDPEQRATLLSAYRAAATDN